MGEDEIMNIKIKELTDGAKLPTPEFESKIGEFTLRFFCGKKALEKTSERDGTKMAPSWEEIDKLLISCNEPISINELMDIFSWKDRSKFRKKYITPLLEEGLIKMTIPDKPRSGNQKYHITEKGKGLVNEHRRN